MKILVLNSGSSSLKYQVIDTETGEMLVKGYYERIGQVGAFLTHKINGEKHHFEHPAKNHEKAIQFVMKRLTSDHYGVFKSLDELDAIGHRVVHGGEQFKDAVLITDEVIQEIKENAMLAPLHNPAAILGIEACQKVVPNKPMVAVFDTAFHQTISKEKYIYPIPYEYYEKYHVRKYGFHGTSHRFVSAALSKAMGKDLKDLKIVSCHLGNGSSITAIENGKSIDTSMGFTPLDGVIMGTRSGAIDASAVTYLAKKMNLSPDEMSSYLNKQCGFLGVSDVSSDNREIYAAINNGDEKAQLTADMLRYEIKKYIGSYAAVMNGLDAVIFTGGIGENSWEVRGGVCTNMDYLGIKIDFELNKTIRGTQAKISTPDSKVEVWVIPTNEELLIARDTLAIISK